MFICYPSGGYLLYFPLAFKLKEVCLGRRRVHRDPSTTEVLLHEGFPVTIEVTQGRGDGGGVM